MRRKKLLGANFEDSINFTYEKDIDLNFEKNSKETTRKEGGVKSLIIFLLIIYFPLQMISLGNEFMLSHNSGSEFPMPKINFLPTYMVPVLVIFWLLAYFPYAFKYDYKNIEVDKGLFFAQQYFLMGTIVFDLWLLTWLSGTIYIHLMPAVFWMFFLIFIVLFSRKKKHIKSVIYKNYISNKFIDINQKLVFILLGGSIVGYFIFKLFFLKKVEATLGLKADIAFFIALIVITFLGIVDIIYFLFPKFIQLFYKIKYREEYREWEGKTQLEWYGEKYFNKHIKGTEKEKKDEY